MSAPSTTLYMHKTGPLVQYENGILFIDNLNPHVSTKWRMTRSEMVRLGLRCIWGGLTRSDRVWDREAA